VQPITIFFTPSQGCQQRTRLDIPFLTAFGRYNSLVVGWDMSANGDPRLDRSEVSSAAEQPGASKHLGVRLDSWKEIAAYLMRSERTVRRWEDTEELPVHRQHHQKAGSVYAYTGELDSWRQSRREPEPDGSERPQQPWQTLLNGNPPHDEQDKKIPGSDRVAPRATHGRAGEQVSSRASLAKFGLWGLLALVAGLFATYAIFRMPRRSVATLTVEPLTTTPGNEVQPALSPDGNEVAFAYNDGHSSGYHIFVKAIDSDEPFQITSDSTDDRSPTWSPDGQSIAFLRFVSNQTAVAMTIPSFGGAERQLAKLQVNGSEFEIRVSWSPDGRWIATSDAQQPNSPMALVLISTATGEKQKLVYSPAPVEADLSPSFSPDGRYLVFARHLGPETANIYMLELPRQGLIAGEARPLTNSNHKNTNPLWMGDGQNIIFVGAHSKLGSQIWKTPAFHPADAVSFNELGHDISYIALNARTNRLVYAKYTEDQNIWRIDLGSAFAAQPGHRRAISQVPLIASTHLDCNPQYSPDGKYIAYQSTRSGDAEIWIAKSDGSSSRQVTRMHAEISGFPRWSPDGKYIVFHSRLNGYGNLFVINVETGSYRKLTTGATNDTAATWSHDGKWIYFESEREDGVQIWKVPAAGGSAKRLTVSSGVVALESADGKLIYYSKVSDTGLWAVPIEGGAEWQVLPTLYGVDNFAITKRGIYFVRRAPNSGAVMSFMSFSGPAIEDLAVVKLPVGRGLAVSPDEDSILYTQFDRADSDLFLVENFR
jgi:Tol biopolymer transport system component